MSARPLYAKPRDLRQAVELLAELGTGTVVVCGGQDLLPYINRGHLQPAVLVDISGLKELEGIEEDGDHIAIGARTVHRALQTHPLVQTRLPLLACAAAQVGGGWQVHNRGTIGGNIAAMHPLYDITPSLLVLDAEIEIETAAGQRRAALRDLLGETDHDLGATALIKRVLLRAQDGNTGWDYQKLKLSAGSYGSANCAALVSLDKAGRIQQLALAVGAAEDRPRLLGEEALAPLQGSQCNRQAGEQLMQLVSAAISRPLSDQRGHGEYRRAMAGVMAQRALAAAAQRANRGVIS